MSASRGLRIAIAGATGNVACELAEVLTERRFPVADVVAFAREGSLGKDVEIAGEVFPVLSEPPALRGLDLLFLCTPASASLEWVREALRAEVPVIDASGCLAGSPDVPLVLADLRAEAHADRYAAAPAVSSPSGPALGWAPALAAVSRVAPLRRVVGTSIRSVAFAGRAGIDALSTQTVALLNQQDPPESNLPPGPFAFDCWPGSDDGEVGSELRLQRDLARLLEVEVPIAAHFVHVPTFAGEGATLQLEFAEPVATDALMEALEKAPALEVRPAEAAGPSTLAAAGGDSVLVRPSPRKDSDPHQVQLWLAFDAVRRAALNLVQIAEARLEAR